MCERDKMVRRFWDWRSLYSATSESWPVRMVLAPNNAIKLRLSALAHSSLLADIAEKSLVQQLQKV
jgi:hypothetical protein